jgi:hypothetical protein
MRVASTVGVLAGVLAAAAPASAQVPLTTTGVINASGGWDPTDALNSQGVALHAVATAVVGGLVPGGAIVSA